MTVFSYRGTERPLNIQKRMKLTIHFCMVIIYFHNWITLTIHNWMNVTVVKTIQNWMTLTIQNWMNNKGYNSSKKRPERLPETIVQKSSSYHKHSSNAHYPVEVGIRIGEISLDRYMYQLRKCREWKKQLTAGNQEAYMQLNTAQKLHWQKRIFHSRMEYIISSFLAQIHSILHKTLGSIELVTRLI